MDKTELKRQLDFNKKALDIVLEIDRIRDVSDGETLFSGLASVMSSFFNLSACLFYVVDRETGESILKVEKIGDKSDEELAEVILQVKFNKPISDGDILILDVDEALPKELAVKYKDSLYLAVLPVFMENQPLGLMLMARKDKAFEKSEIELMLIAESQLDSAIIQAYNYHDLAMRNKELETVYKFDTIRDKNLPFGEMLEVVLHELCSVIDSEMAYVILYDKQGEFAEMHSVSKDNLIEKNLYQEKMKESAKNAIASGDLICENYEGPECKIMAIPLILRDAVIGVFGAVNRDIKSRFTDDQEKLIRAVVSQMDTAIFESLEQQRLRRVLGRSVDPRIMERLLSEPNLEILEGERVTLTVLFADLRGSTQLAQNLEPNILVQFINDYLDRMARTLYAHEGTLDKFVGDEVMGLFGAPLPQPDHALRAIRVGLAMQKEHSKLMDGWRARGIEPAAVGVGIATGEVTVGEFGSEQRTDYTIIGHAANLGARICGQAKPGEVLISQETYDLVKDSIEAVPMDAIQLKGIYNEVMIYSVKKVL